MSHVDKGWSWVILFAIFWANVINGIQYCSVTIFYFTFLQVFEESRAFTSWLGSLNSIMVYCCGGPLASYLLNKIGIRNMLFIAAGCATVAYIIIAVSTSLIVIILAYGIFGGIAFGFSYTGAVAAIALYFNRHLFKASCAGLVGAGIGTVTYGPLVEWFMQMYGWRGASLLLAGVSLQVFIVASTIFPVPQSPPSKDPYQKRPIRRGPRSQECSNAGSTEVTAEVQQCQVAENDSEEDCKHAMIQRRSGSPTSSGVEFQSSTRNSTKTLKVHRLYSDVRFWCLSYVAFTWGFCVMIFISIQKDVIVSAGLAEHFQHSVVTLGIANTVARILVCFLTFDNVLLSYMFVLLLGGIIVMFYTVIANYWTLMVVSLFTGLFLGALYVMLPMSVGAIFGRQNMATTYGYVLFSAGLGSLGGPSLTGYLRDVTGFYNVSLYLIGSVQVTGAIVAGFLHFRMKYWSTVT